MSVQEKQRERLSMANNLEAHSEPAGVSSETRRMIIEALRACATPVAWRWRLGERHPWGYDDLIPPPELPAGSECQPLYAADLPTTTDVPASKPAEQAINDLLLMMAEKLLGHISTNYDPQCYRDDMKDVAAILRRTHEALAIMQEIVSDDSRGKYGRLAREAIKRILNPQQEVLVVQRDDSKPFGLVGHLIPVDREMEKQLKEARAKVSSMSAAELDEMLHKQGVGWARSEAQWAKDFREGKTDRD